MRYSSPKIARVKAAHWLVSILVAVLCLVGWLDTASAQFKTQTQVLEQKKREANDISAAIIVSGLSCTCARFAEDMRNVINDLRPDGIRVLPVLGVGGLQNLKDVLFLKGIDMGIVDQDNLALLKQRDPRLFSDIEQRVHYITKLYNAELHVLARNDIKSLLDLKGRRVNFNVKEHQTEVTGDHLFSMLNIHVEKTNYDNDEAIRRLMNGELAAMMIVSGAPQAGLARIRKEDGLHFVPVDQDSLPGIDFTPVITEYLPAEFTSKTYPNLVPEGTSVPTIANRALLVSYAWPEGSARYNRIAKFVNEFFGKIDEFHSPARHPKWSEINLWADIPGWTRFKPAAQWLASHQQLAHVGTQLAKDQSENVQQTIGNMLANTSGRDLSPSEKEALINRIRQYLESNQTAR